MRPAARPNVLRILTGGWPLPFHLYPSVYDAVAAPAATGRRRCRSAWRERAVSNRSETVGRGCAEAPAALRRGRRCPVRLDLVRVARAAFRADETWVVPPFAPGEETRVASIQHFVRVFKRKCPYTAGPAAEGELFACLRVFATGGTHGSGHTEVSTESTNDVYVRASEVGRPVALSLTGPDKAVALDCVHVRPPL